MRCISSKDEELLKSINLMMNMPLNKEHLLEQLRNHYNNNPEDVEAVFSYGFYNFLSVSKIVDSNIRIETIKLILNCYDQAISIAEDYWMIYMFKGVLLMSLPEIMQDDDEFIKTINSMFDLQEQSEVKYNYFSIPYIMIADYYMSNNNIVMAMDYIKKAKELDNIQKVEFKCLNDYLKKPLKNFINRLQHSQENILANEMIEFHNKNFA